MAKTIESCADVGDTETIALAAIEAHTFDNDGTSTVGRLERRGSGWVMTGEWPNHGETFAVRCTTVFESRAYRQGTWEYSKDGSTWRIFWQTRAERLS